MAGSHRGISAIERLEHSDENDAKKVNLYEWNGSAWVRGGSTAGNFAVCLDDTTTTNVTYVGMAAIASATSAAVWQVQKIDESSGLVITWADGNDNFDNVYDNRASLTYS